MSLEYGVVIGFAVVGGLALAVWLAIRDSKRMTRAEWEREKNIEDIEATAASIVELVEKIEEKVLETEGVDGIENLRTLEDPENRLSATERKYYEAKLKELEEQKDG